MKKFWKKLQAKCALTPDEELHYMEVIRLSKFPGCSSSRWERGLWLRRNWPVASMVLAIATTVTLGRHQR